jgi:hypothetical protein
MTNAGFVIAAYGVILGGLGLYVAYLLRRLGIARDASKSLGGDVDEAP